MLIINLHHYVAKILSSNLNKKYHQWWKLFTCICCGIGNPLDCSHESAITLLSLHKNICDQNMQIRNSSFDNAQEKNKLFKILKTQSILRPEIITIWATIRKLKSHHLSAVYQFILQWRFEHYRLCLGCQ